MNSKFYYRGILQLHNLRKPDPPAKPDGGSKPDDSAKPVCPPKPGAPAKPDNAAMQQAHETSSTSITPMDTSEPIHGTICHANDKSASVPVCYGRRVTSRTEITCLEDAIRSQRTHTEYHSPIGVNDIGRNPASGSAKRFQPIRGS